ncbi:hypothetical protein K490DRAFT_62200 [Saccharata proteae CBS 121410]|uniref:Uncharacterized protein n=1 Tax=Saccharata proteae CBS 121410 TaxID=1314787 RepID=A0A9P4I163_9PEZI|nr:hypothetical protein K490DRAFT_62200 [Saccharata proteae CBS 121410]
MISSTDRRPSVTACALFGILTSVRRPFEAHLLGPIKTRPLSPTISSPINDTLELTPSPPHTAPNLCSPSVDSGIGSEKTFDHIGLDADAAKSAEPSEIAKPVICSRVSGSARIRIGVSVSRTAAPSLAAPQLIQFYLYQCQRAEDEHESTEYNEAGSRAGGDGAAAAGDLGGSGAGGHAKCGCYDEGAGGGEEGRCGVG